MKKMGTGQVIKHHQGWVHKHSKELNSAFCVYSIFRVRKGAYFKTQPNDNDEVPMRAGQQLVGPCKAAWSILCVRSCHMCSRAQGWTMIWLNEPERPGSHRKLHTHTHTHNSDVLPCEWRWFFWNWSIEHLHPFSGDVIHSKSWPLHSCSKNCCLGTEKHHIHRPQIPQIFLSNDFPQCTPTLHLAVIISESLLNWPLRCWWLLLNSVNNHRWVPNGYPSRTRAFWRGRWRPCARGEHWGSWGEPVDGWGTGDSSMAGHGLSKRLEIGSFHGSQCFEAAVDHGLRRSNYSDGKTTVTLIILLNIHQNLRRFELPQITLPLWTAPFTVRGSQNAEKWGCGTLRPGVWSGLQYTGLAEG